MAPAERGRLRLNEDAGKEKAEFYEAGIGMFNFAE